MISLAYGRPLNIHPGLTRDLVLPSVRDVDQPAVSARSPVGQSNSESCWIACYIEAVKLQEILGEILAAFYYGGSDPTSNSSASYTGPRSAESQKRVTSLLDKTKAGDFQDLFVLDRLMSDWKRNLPDHLKTRIWEGGCDLGPETCRRYSSSTQPSTIERPPDMFTRQANILKTR